MIAFLEFVYHLYKYDIYKSWFRIKGDFKAYRGGSVRVNGGARGRNFKFREDVKEYKLKLKAEVEEQEKPGAAKGEPLGYIHARVHRHATGKWEDLGLISGPEQVTVKDKEE